MEILGAWDSGICLYKATCPIIPSIPPGCHDPPSGSRGQGRCRDLSLGPRPPEGPIPIIKTQSHATCQIEAKMERPRGPRKDEGINRYLEVLKSI